MCLNVHINLVYLSLHYFACAVGMDTGWTQGTLLQTFETSQGVTLVYLSAFKSERHPVSSSVLAIPNKKFNLNRHQLTCCAITWRPKALHRLSPSIHPSFMQIDESQTLQHKSCCNSPPPLWLLYFSCCCFTVDVWQSRQGYHLTAS